MTTSSLNLSYWILQTVAMLLTCFLIPRLKLTSPLGALAMVIALAFVNAHVWDAALFFRIPDSINAQALTLLISNGVVFWLLVKVLPGIEVRGFLPALAAPILFTVLSVFIGKYGEEVEWGKLWKSGIEFVESNREKAKISPSQKK